MHPSYAHVAHNIACIRDRLNDACRRAGRDAAEVTLLAVAKRHPAEAVAAAAAAGVLDIGESYLQEALAKQATLADDRLRWHFVGGLQSRKAKEIPGAFRLLHSLDSEKLARKLHTTATALHVVQPVLIQVNVGEETQKSGVAPEALPRLAEAIAGMDGLALHGLMCLPPFTDDPDEARPHFARLRELRDELSQRLNVSLPTLSMGMTGDFPQAVAEGSTCVRVGTAIFGPRDAPAC